MGLLILGLNIANAREAVLETFEFSYRRRKALLAQQAALCKEAKKMTKRRNDRRLKHFASFKSRSNSLEPTDTMEVNAAKDSALERNKYTQLQNQLRHERAQEFRVKLATSTTVFFLFWLVRVALAFYVIVADMTPFLPLTRTRLITRVNFAYLIM